MVVILVSRWVDRIIVVLCVVFLWISWCRFVICIGLSVLVGLLRINSVGWCSSV